MEQANKFFFLAGVSYNAKCDFERQGDSMVLTFCHMADAENTDRLFMKIRTESSIDHNTQKEVKDHYVSYVLNCKRGTVKQGESLPIRNPLAVWEIVVECVNDVFPVDAENQIA